jgi:hypothetical protein
VCVGERSAVSKLSLTGLWVSTKLVSVNATRKTRCVPVRDWGLNIEFSTSISHWICSPMKVLSADVTRKRKCVPVRGEVSFPKSISQWSCLSAELVPSALTKEIRRWRVNQIRPLVTTLSDSTPSLLQLVDVCSSKYLEASRCHRSTCCRIYLLSFLGNVRKVAVGVRDIAAVRGQSLG